jgi:hypothetical protein
MKVLAIDMLKVFFNLGGWILVELFSGPGSSECPYTSSRLLGGG